MDIATRDVHGHRLLVIVVPQALEPIRVNGRIRWRVGPNCVDVDPHTWHAKRMAVMNYDWSSEESSVPVASVRSAAVQHARDLLLASEEPHAAELAAQSDTNLLRRLNVLTPEGYLTNAGVLAFVGRGEPGLDYVRRAHAGGDSLVRVRRSGRSLLEELVEVFAALEANTPTIHLQQGLVIGQQREIPLRAAREAIVNGVAHREWAIQEPTVVEHVGRTLQVTSPGGFVGGVTAENIITHPSRSRNKALAELLTALRVAEREGVGVDRMIGDMLRRGNPRPDIAEISGPYVRVSLTSDAIDQSWIAWLRSITPLDESADVNSLLMLRHLVDEGWIDAIHSAQLIQDTVVRAQGALAKLSRAVIDGSALIVTLEGVPDTAEPVWVLSSPAKVAMARLDREVGQVRRTRSRESLAIDYVSSRGRISSTELGGLVGADPTNLGAVLRRLEDEGWVAPAWPSRRGKGFHYVLVDRGTQQA